MATDEFMHSEPEEDPSQDPPTNEEVILQLQIHLLMFQSGKLLAGETKYVLCIIHFNIVLLAQSTAVESSMIECSQCNYIPLALLGFLHSIGITRFLSARPFLCYIYSLAIDVVLPASNTH